MSIVIVIGNHQKKLSSRRDDFRRHIEQAVAQRLDLGRMFGFGQAQALEPGHQIEGQLPDQKPRPVGVEFPGRQLLQPEAGLILLNIVLHDRNAQVGLRKHVDSLGDALETVSNTSEIPLHLFSDSGKLLQAYSPPKP